MTHETHPVVFCVEDVPTMLSCDPEMFLRMSEYTGGTASLVTRLVTSQGSYTRLVRGS